MSVTVTSAPVTASRRSPPDRPASVRAVVRRGLLDRRRAVLTWGLSLGVYGAFMAAIYPSIQSSIEKIAKSYPGWPQGGVRRPGDEHR